MYGNGPPASSAVMVLPLVLMTAKTLSRLAHDAYVVILGSITKIEIERQIAIIIFLETDTLTSVFE